MAMKEVKRAGGGANPDIGEVKWVVFGKAEPNPNELNLTRNQSIEGFLIFRGEVNSKFGRQFLAKLYNAEHDTTYVFWVNSRILREQIEQVPDKHFTRVVYRGFQKSKNGRKYKDFVVYYDDELKMQ